MTTRFDLQADTGPPAGFVAPRDAAAALGVSTVTLQTWRDKGMVGPELAIEGRSKFGPTWFYHVANCRAWLEKNRGAGVGGKRDGAGRPRKKNGEKRRRDEETKAGRPPPGADVSSDTRPAPSAVRQTLDPGSPIEAAAIAAMTEDEWKEHQRLERLASRLTNIEAVNFAVLKGEITRTQGQSLCDLMKFNAGHTALQAERGRKVDIDKVAERWMGDVAIAVEGLKRLASRQADRIAARQGLSPEERLAVQRDCAAEIAAYQAQTWDQIRARRVASPSATAAA